MRTPANDTARGTPSLRKPRPAPSFPSPEETKFLTCKMNMLGYKMKPERRFRGEEFHSRDMNNYRSAGRRRMGRGKRKGVEESEGRGEGGGAERRD